MTLELLTPITSLKDGLEFILSHCDYLWPRTISTYATGGRQRVVHDSREALAWFNASKLLNARISAYPKYTDYHISHTGIAPSELIIDLDREQFATDEEFELAAIKTYINCKEILGSEPTQLWTRSGYHFIVRHI